jgi:hypothetical protein
MRIDTWPPLDLSIIVAALISTELTRNKADKKNDKQHCTRTNSIRHGIFNRKGKEKGKSRPLSNISLALPISSSPQHSAMQRFTKKNSLHSLPLSTTLLRPGGSRGSYVTLLHPLSSRIQQTMHVAGHATPPCGRRTPINPLEIEPGTRQLPAGFRTGTRCIGGRRAIRTARRSCGRWKGRCDLPAATVGSAREFVGGEGVA